MAKGDLIPDSDHVARLCTKIRDFMDPGEMTELKADTFAPDDDGTISVNWLEYHDGDFATRKKRICYDLAARNDVRAAHKLAVCAITRIKAIGNELSCELWAEHDPEPDNDSHSSILGVPLDAYIVHQVLADAASEWLENAVRYKKRSAL